MRRSLSIERKHYWNRPDAYPSVGLCVSVWPESVLWQNGWLNPDAVWDIEWGRWRDGCIRRGPCAPRERVILGCVVPICFNGVFFERVHALHQWTNFYDLYVIWRLSMEGCAFCGLSWYISPFKVYGRHLVNCNNSCEKITRILYGQYIAGIDGSLAFWRYSQVQGRCWGLWEMCTNVTASSHWCRSSNVRK